MKKSPVYVKYYKRSTQKKIGSFFASRCMYVIFVRYDKTHIRENMKTKIRITYTRGPTQAENPQKYFTTLQSCINNGYRTISRGD